MPRDRLLLNLTLGELGGRLTDVGGASTRDEWFRGHDGSALTDEEVLELARRITGGTDEPTDPSSPRA